MSIARQSYHECKAKLDITNGKVMSLTVQLTERDQNESRLIKEHKAQLAVTDQEVDLAKKCFEERMAHKDARVKNLESA